MKRKDRKKVKTKDTPSILGRHYEHIVTDDLVINTDHPLLGGPVANNADPKNWPQNSALTLQTIEEAIEKLWNSNMRISGDFVMMINPGLHDIFRQLLNDLKEWSPEEMAKQVEIYRNVIETKYGVKLAVKRNPGANITSMELLVPNTLFHGDDGREKLADALQNIAMFVLSMDDPAL